MGLGWRFIIIIKHPKPPERAQILNFPSCPERWGCWTLCNLGMGWLGDNSAPLPGCSSFLRNGSIRSNQIIQAPGESCHSSLRMGSREQGEIWADSQGAAHIHIPRRDVLCPAMGRTQGNTWGSICGWRKPALFLHGESCFCSA